MTRISEKNQMLRTILTLVVFSILVSAISCDNGKNQSRNDARESILDSARLLNVQQRDSIVSLINSLEKEIGSQIAVITVGTLNGENINEFSLRTAEKMQLGRSEFDDGILISVVSKDHQIRIEVGYGLEKIVRDEIAARIIREDMVPKFREGDFGSGIKRAVEKIIGLIKDHKELVGQRM